MRDLSNDKSGNILRGDVAWGWEVWGTERLNGERGDNKGERDERFFWERIEKRMTGMEIGKKIIEKKKRKEKKRKEKETDERK